MDAGRGTSCRPRRQRASQNAQGDVRVTVYNNNLALVQDTRQLTLPAGRSRQEFADVSAQIRPETVSFDAAGVGIVEQNFDYNLLSPSSLMQKAVGATLTVVRTNPATGARRASRRGCCRSTAAPCFASATASGCCGTTDCLFASSLTAFRTICAPARPFP